MRISRFTSSIQSRLVDSLHGDRFYRDTRQGDAILFTQNNYDKGIQNGSLGTLVSTEAVGEHYGVVELDTGDQIGVTQSLLDCMELGYYITLHKAPNSRESSSPYNEVAL